MLPKSLKNFNAFIDGEGYAGRVDEFVLPKLARKMEELRAGGMNAPIDIDMGMEKLEAEFTLHEVSRAILNQFGLWDVSGVGMRFRGAYQADDSSCTTDAVEVVMRGRFKEIDMGTAKTGDDTKMKVNGSLTYFKYIVNDEVVIEIDVLNMIEMVNGEDRLKKQRDALGL